MRAGGGDNGTAARIGAAQAHGVVTVKLVAGLDAAGVLGVDLAQLVAFIVQGAAGAVVPHQHIAIAHDGAHAQLEQRGPGVLAADIEALFAGILAPGALDVLGSRRAEVGPIQMGSGPWLPTTKSAKLPNTASYHSFSRSIARDLLTSRQRYHGSRCQSALPPVSGAAGARHGRMDTIRAPRGRWRHTPPRSAPAYARPGGAAAGGAAAGAAVGR